MKTVNTSWREANHTPFGTNRIVYFLTRTVDGEREDMKTPTDRLKTWRTRSALEKFLANNK